MKLHCFQRAVQRVFYFLDCTLNYSIVLDRHGEVELKLVSDDQDKDQDNDINHKLVSRVRSRPKSADHDCKVELWMPANQKNRFHWPKMNASNLEVLRDPERIIH